MEYGLAADSTGDTSDIGMITGWTGITSQIVINLFWRPADEICTGLPLQRSRGVRLKVHEHLWLLGGTELVVRGLQGETIIYR